MITVSEPRLFRHSWDEYGEAEECTVAHYPTPDGDPGGGCKKCFHCREWVRPHLMREGCPALMRRFVPLPSPESLGRELAARKEEAVMREFMRGGDR